MDPRRLVFWQSALSQHQSAHLRALNDVVGWPVTLVVTERVPQWRRELGWYEPDFGGVRVVVALQPGEASNVIDAAGPEAIHVFSGMRAGTLQRGALRLAAKAGRRAGLMAESGDPRGGMGYARRVVGRIDAVRLGRSISFVLAIGHTGMEWYERCGFPLGMLYPYAYFTETPVEHQRTGPSVSDDFEITFVGNLIHRKGVDILIAALARVRTRAWRLAVIGDGPERGALTAMARRLGIGDRVVWHGALPNAEVGEAVAGSDLLVLPSRWDGWGAVVNEALMRGVPALCSSACGVADLLHTPLNGGVFESGDADALRTMLEARMEMGKPSEEHRARLRGWSSAIEGLSGATYLVQVLESMDGQRARPSPPWLTAR